LRRLAIESKQKSEKEIEKAAINEGTGGEGEPRKNDNVRRVKARGSSSSWTRGQSSSPAK